VFCTSIMRIVRCDSSAFLSCWERCFSFSAGFVYDVASASKQRVYGPGRFVRGSREKRAMVVEQIICIPENKENMRYPP